jgi:hypothetical protein
MKSYDLAEHMKLLCHRFYARVVDEYPILVEEAKRLIEQDIAEMAASWSRFRGVIRSKRLGRRVVKKCCATILRDGCCVRSVRSLS